jgi:hypothetical protein
MGREIESRLDGSFKKVIMLSLSYLCSTIRDITCMHTRGRFFSTTFMVLNFSPNYEVLYLGMKSCT